MALILARHTRPAVEGLCYGRTDPPLAPEFGAEAEALLAALGAVGRIVSSPLGRCRRLADVLGARLGVPVTEDADWREMDFGTWEGRRWEAVPRAELDAWAADFMDARPHGGESVAMLLARTRRAIAAAATGGPVLVVTHAGPIRAALFAGGEGPGAWRRVVPFGGLVEIDVRAHAGAHSAHLDQVVSIAEDSSRRLPPLNEG